MRLRKLHEWNVGTAEARKIQENLRKLWVSKDQFGEIRTVAGLDAAFVLSESQALKKKSSWQKMREANRAIGGVVIYRFPEMTEIERTFAIEPLRFPYVPGLLSFREIPVLLAALQKLKRLPDLLFFDGQGIAHPRRLGLATHAGIVLDRPTIGCAKSILIGKHGKLPEKGGSWSYLKDGQETIGAAVRIRDGVRPVYVSQGNRVSLETAIRLTLAASDGRRIPKPTREADRYVSQLKREYFPAAGKVKL